METAILHTAQIALRGREGMGEEEGETRREGEKREKKRGGDTVND